MCGTAPGPTSAAAAAGSSATVCVVSLASFVARQETYAILKVRHQKTKKRLRIKKNNNNNQTKTWWSGRLSVKLVKQKTTRKMVVSASKLFYIHWLDQIIPCRGLALCTWISIFHMYCDIYIHKPRIAGNVTTQVTGSSIYCNSHKNIQVSKDIQV